MGHDSKEFLSAILGLIYPIDKIIPAMIIIYNTSY